MSGRANPIPELGTAAAVDLLATVQTAFGKSWLEANYGNPIQLLWRRHDTFATSELMILGEAIKKLAVHNPAWVERRVKVVKSRKPKVRIGDVFELLGLAMLSCSEQVVIPARENQPGYDGLVKLPNGCLIYMSMKNYDISSHEAHFLSRSKATDLLFSKTQESQYLNGIALIAAAGIYPEEKDWQLLNKEIPTFLQQARSTFVRQFQCGIWQINLCDVPSGEGCLASYPISCQSTIFGPFHRNEQKNLLSRLSEAAHNFVQHAEQCVGPLVSRCIFVRVATTAPLDACVQWCEDYLLDAADGPVDGIFLYQPATAVISSETSIGIIHHISAVMKKNFDGFIGQGGETSILRFQVLIGSMSVTPSRLEFAKSGVKLNSCYMYQHGNVYRESIPRADGTINGYVRYIAPGVLQHSVLRMNGIPGSLILSGKLPVTDTLLLYT